MKLADSSWKRFDEYASNLFVMRTFVTYLRPAINWLLLWHADYRLLTLCIEDCCFSNSLTSIPKKNKIPVSVTRCWYLFHFCQSCMQHIRTDSIWIKPGGACWTGVICCLLCKHLNVWFSAVDKFLSNYHLELSKIHECYLSIVDRSSSESGVLAQSKNSASVSCDLCKNRFKP